MVRIHYLRRSGTLAVDVHRVAMGTQAARTQEQARTCRRRSRRRNRGRRRAPRTAADRKVAQAAGSDGSAGWVYGPTRGERGSRLQAMQEVDALDGRLSGPRNLPISRPFSSRRARSALALSWKWTKPQPFPSGVLTLVTSPQARK